MTRPREVLPGSFYFVTRRCTQRQFLLRPDAETNNAFAYCLAVAASRCAIDVIVSVAESNHHHTVIFDREGRYPEMIEHLHKLVARCQNALRGRWENLWASEETCVVRLVDRAAVMAKLVYAVTNPVKDSLVTRARHWPGVNTYRELVGGRPLRARRPRHFFRDGGVMPEHVQLAMTIPPALGPAAEVIAELRREVEAVELACDARRAQTGARVVGRRGILARAWDATPTSRAPRRNLRPRYAASDPERRIVALLCFQEFLALYRDARDRWRTGAAATFPRGTYWLRRFAGVTVVHDAA